MQPDACGITLLSRWPLHAQVLAPHFFPEPDHAHVEAPSSPSTAGRLAPPPTSPPGSTPAQALSKHPGQAGAPAGEASADPRRCPQCGTGRLVLKPSRTGGFIGCTNFSREKDPCGYGRPLIGVQDGACMIIPL